MDETTAPTPPEPPAGGAGTAGPAATPGAGGAGYGAGPGYGPAGPAGPPPSSGSGADAFFDSVRRTGIVRSQERWAGGVAGGLALRLGVDPLVTRGVLAASVLLGGFGLVVYAIGWLLLPEQSDGRIHLQQLFRGDFDAAVLGALALFVAGASFPDTPGLWWAPDTGWWRALVGLSIAALVVVLVVSAANRRTGAPPRAPWAPGAAGAPGEASTAAASGRVPGASATGAPLAATSTTTSPATSPAAVPPRRRSEGPTTTMYPTTTQPTGAYPAPGAGPQQPAPAWQAGPQATGPATAPPRPAAPTTALPRTAPRGPGAGVVGVVVALSLLTLAGLWYAERVDRFDGPVVLTAGAVAVTLLGLAILVSGLRGRTAGGLGALAVVLTLVLLPMATFDRWAWRDGWQGWDGGQAVGDVRATPTSAEEAEEGYSVGAGQIDLDLTELTLGAGETVEVPVGVGAGDLTIQVPEGTAVTAEIQIMAGEIRWLDDEVRSASGVDGSRSFATDEVTEGTDPALHLDISVGAGNVRVEERP